MKPFVWNDGMTVEETKDGAYWERNMLALFYAKTMTSIEDDFAVPNSCGWYFDTDNNWDGWKRVISLEKGKVTFHIPDDFDLGDLQEIKPNWDGHSTELKWNIIMEFCGVYTTHV